MPAYKNKENGSWYVVTQYTDWTGERKPKCKRGFATRREALEWEQKFQQQSAGDLDMSFEAFCEIYTNDLKARLKESTWQTKENIIKTKLLPYFGKRKINEITTKDVIAWQNELLTYRWLISLEGEHIALPERFYPNRDCLSYHNDVIFKG